MGAAELLGVSVKPAQLDAWGLLPLIPSDGLAAIAPRGDLRS